MLYLNVANLLNSMIVFNSRKTKVIKKNSLLDSYVFLAQYKTNLKKVLCILVVTVRHRGRRVNASQKLSMLIVSDGINRVTGV